MKKGQNNLFFVQGSCLDLIDKAQQPQNEVTNSEGSIDEVMEEFVLDDSKYDGENAGVKVLDDYKDEKNQ